MKIKNYIIISVGILIITFISCKKKVDDSDVNFNDNKTSDAELLELAIANNDFEWYKFSDDLLNPGARTGHLEEQLRTRYNQVAKSNLDSLGKVIENSKFPENSLIVKELFKNGKLDTYAIMYKKTGDENADDNGWVWGYIRENGNIRNAADRKGQGCIGCHSISGNIDLTLMNAEHP